MDREQYSLIRYFRRVGAGPYSGLAMQTRLTMVSLKQTGHYIPTIYENAQKLETLCSVQGANLLKAYFDKFHNPESMEF